MSNCISYEYLKVQNCISHSNRDIPLVTFSRPMSRYMKIKTYNKITLDLFWINQLTDDIKTYNLYE